MELGGVGRIPACFFLEVAPVVTAVKLSRRACGLGMSTEADLPARARPMAEGLLMRAISMSRWAYLRGDACESAMRQVATRDCEDVQEKRRN